MKTIPKWLTLDFVNLTVTVADLQRESTEVAWDLIGNVQHLAAAAAFVLGPTIGRGRWRRRLVYIETDGLSHGLHVAADGSLWTGGHHKGQTWAFKRWPGKTFPKYTPKHVADLLVLYLDWAAVRLASEKAKHEKFLETARRLDPTPWNL